MIIGLRWDKELLHNRINARVKLMMEQGLLDEVRELQEQLCKEAAQGVGYKEIIDHFKGKHDKAHAAYLVRRNTRKLAKQQRTWYRRWLDIVWMPGAAEDLHQRAIDRCTEFLQDS